MNKELEILTIHLEEQVKKFRAAQTLKERVSSFKQIKRTACKLEQKLICKKFKYISPSVFFDEFIEKVNNELDELFKWRMY